MDDPKEVNLCLYNPLKRAVRVHSVSTLSKSIKIHYYNVRINPASDDANKPNMCVNVGTLTLDCKFLNLVYSYTIYRVTKCFGYLQFTPYNIHKILKNNTLFN